MSDKRDPETKKLQKYIYQIDCELYDVDPKIVLLESFHGQNISDSALEIARELHRFYKDEYKIYFATENPEKHQAYAREIGLDYVELIDVNSLHYTKVLATAGHIFANTGLPIYFIKREGQVYVQMWHGTPLKTIGKDTRMGINTIYLPQHGLLQADYLTHPNEFTKNIIMEAYNLENLFTGKVVMASYPRNKILHQPEKGQDLRRKLGLSDKTVYGYMPTWRGANVAERDSEDFEKYIVKLFDHLDEQMSDDQLLYVNFHPILRGEIKVGEYKHIREFPTDIDTYSFLNCTDALITDYSSVFFDYALTKKPIILFTFDYEQYASERGLLINITDLPFRQINEEEDFIKCLVSEACLEDDYSESDFYRTYCKYDSVDATSRLIELAFTGRNNGFEIIDYSANKEKPVKIIEPMQFKSKHDFEIIEEMADKNSVVFLARSRFKEKTEPVLYDYFNHAFDYVITTKSVPKSFSEERLEKKGDIHTIRELEQRDIARLLPGLMVVKHEVIPKEKFRTKSSK